MNNSRKILLGATGLALGTALISGTNTFLAKIAVSALSSPIAFTCLKNGIVALALVGIIVAFGKWREILNLSRKQKIQLLAVGIIGGTIPFALFFTGLTMTGAVNAAFIHKTLFIWVAIMAIPFLKEKVTPLHWLGIVMIFAANLLIGGFKGFAFNLGELMILAATVFWAVENIVAKKALAELSVITVAGARMAIGSILLLAYLTATGGMSVFSASISPAAWGWTMLTSVLLLGYVLTWYSALKRAPATYVTTLLVPATLVTNVLAAIFLTQTFNLQQVGAATLFLAGAALVVLFASRANAGYRNMEIRTDCGLYETR